MTISSTSVNVRFVRSVFCVCWPCGLVMIFSQPVITCQFGCPKLIFTKPVLCFYGIGNFKEIKL